MKYVFFWMNNCLERDKVAIFEIERPKKLSTTFPQILQTIHPLIEYHSAKIRPNMT